MASVNNVVSITISKGTKSVSVQGFNVATIFGASNRIGSDPIRYYTNPSDMLTDGFQTSDPEYKFAVALMSQTPSPKRFGVSKYTAAVAQVRTITPDVSVQSAQHFIETIDGVAYDFTSDSTPTAAEVVTGLKTLINADSGAGVTASGTSTLILTAKVAGVGFTASESTNLVGVASIDNHSIVSDIAALQLIDDSWYGVLVTSHAASDIKQVAAYVESQLKFYATSSSDSHIITADTDDLATYLKARSYARTALLYSGTPSDGPEAAWVGRMFPTTPGAANWNFKTLAGIAVDELNNTQIANAQGKNANVYITMGGVDIATSGVTPGGEFIDVTIFLDWLASNMQANIFSALVNAPKIPYTNQGITIVENRVAQTLQQGQDNGGLVAGWTVTAPDVSQISTNDKANRELNGVEFLATLAGAVNKVNVQGFISV